MFDNKVPLATRQFSKFVVVGLISTAINYGVFLILLHPFSSSYLIASAVGFGAGTLFGYELNKNWTYASRETAGGMLPKYLLLYTVSLVAGLLFLRSLVHYAGLSPELANFLTIGLTTVINFLGTKFLVFKR